MNNYEESLKSTTIATLSALAAEQEQLDSERTAEHYKLYYAQGAQLTAIDKRNETQGLLVPVSKINDECLANENAAFNLLATATTANSTVSVSNTNMATAAANVQIASEAISALAAEIGAALNNATASLYGTDAYQKILNANSLINEVANDAKYTSNIAMMASSNTSEIIAGPVLTQTTAFKAKVDGLLKATQAELDKFNTLYVAQQAAVGKASIAERQVEGAVLDADCEARAIAAAYAHASAQLNLGLSAKVKSASSLMVTFNALPPATFRATPASTVPIPSMGPQYYVTLVPASKQATLTTDLTEQIFQTWTSTNKPAPGTGTPATGTTATGTATADTAAAKPGADTRFVNMNPGSKQLTFTQDIFGDPIQAGQQYVAFVYVHLSNEYKFFISNYSDWLSAPSASFTMADTLPVATGITTSGKAPALSVTFTAVPYTPQQGSVEYRCMLVEEDPNDISLRLMRSAESPKSPIFFDLEVALQVSRANYEPAKLATPVVPAPQPQPAMADDPMPEGDQPAPEPAAAADCPAPQNNTWRADFSLCSTDNFGNPLRPDGIYRPYVLATIIDGNPDACTCTLAAGDQYPASKPTKPAAA